MSPRRTKLLNSTAELPNTEQAAPAPRGRGRRNRNKPGPSQPREPNDLHDIPSFCTANKISQSYYFALKRQGRGPREIKMGRATRITPEAERDWRREREAETMARRARSAEAERVEA